MKRQEVPPWHPRARHNERCQAKRHSAGKSSSIRLLTRKDPENRGEQSRIQFNSRGQSDHDPSQSKVSVGKKDERQNRHQGGENIISLQVPVREKWHNNTVKEKRQKAF